jgi:hypothetical protein
MTIEQSVVETLKALPPEKQREVLDFARFLRRQGVVKHPRRSLKGALAHLNVRLTSEDIAEARREMWGEYMREGDE